MYVIYALIDPRDHTVHYVGQTRNVYARFKAHLNGDGGTFGKKAWIFELRAANRMIIMETLEEVETLQEALSREAYWIRHFQTLKQPLSNAIACSEEREKDNRTSAKTAMRIQVDLEEIRTRAKGETREEVSTLEQEALIIKTVAQMQRDGLPVTREAIKLRLGWNNAKHPVVKFVCDKHKIAIR